MQLVVTVFALLAAAAADRKSASFIYHGNTATSPIPYQALLKVNGEFNCGGTLISPRHILTAAHCVVNLGFSANASDALPAKNLSITMGELKRSEDDGTEQELAVERVAVHPNFAYSILFVLRNDIAVLELSKPVSINKFVKPIGIAKAEVKEAKCRVSGWGFSEKTENVDQLQYVDMIAYESSRCKWGQKQQYLCLKDTKGKASACNGDSGGPIVCPIEGKKYVSGVVSHSVKSCGKGLSIISNVALYAPWIEKVMAQA